MNTASQRVMATLDSVIGWFSTPHHLRGIGLMRACLGWIVVYIYTVNWAQRDILFGPYRITTTPNGFFGLLPGVTGFQIMYHLAIVCAICLAMGWGGRLFAVLTFLFFWSYTTAATLTGDGGDNLMRLILFYLMFTRFSKQPLADEPSLWQRVGAVAHNVAWMAIVTQLCIMYWDAGFQKAAGDMWRDGTALYYVLQVSTFRYPPIADAMLAHPTLVVFMNYATMVFQSAFPFLMLNRWSKYAAIAISMSFHIGIMLSMCLISFSAVMIATELAFLSDADYASLEGFIRSITLAVSGRFRPAARRDRACA